MENPSNSLEWMLFLTEKYLKMFVQGTWITLYIAVIGTILGFILGYIIGIIQDMKLSDGDFFLKKILSGLSILVREKAPGQWGCRQ